MKLPIWVISLLPENAKEHQIQKYWDDKSDEQILDSFKDAKEWIEISKGIFKSETTIEIARDCERRLDRFITPQMNKRGLAA